MALRVPTVPAAAGAGVASGSDGDADVDPFTGCTDELQIRATLRTAERTRAPEGTNSDDVPPPPVPMLRQRAVLRLAEIELDTADSGPRSSCRDLHLDQLLAELDPGPAVQRQLATAYCVQRSTQLLAGHAVDADSAAIHRLALWTILDSKWPLLASHLRRRPQDLVHLWEETPATDIEAELALVFADPVAQRLADALGRPTSRDDIADSARRSGRARPRVMTCTTGAHRPPPANQLLARSHASGPPTGRASPGRRLDRLPGVDPAARSPTR